MPFIDDVERFFAMLRFDSREKLKDFQMEMGKLALFLLKMVRILSLV